MTPLMPNNHGQTTATWHGYIDCCAAGRADNRDSPSLTLPGRDLASVAAGLQPPLQQDNTGTRMPLWERLLIRSSVLFIDVVLGMPVYMFVAATAD